MFNVMNAITNNAGELSKSVGHVQIKALLAWMQGRCPGLVDVEINILLLAELLMRAHNASGSYINK